ncbi:precorrin-3B synthase [Hyphomicrobium sp. CS1GBMeth3]|uniref:precorrin-3B synthase n=1 Tax=Hyphomicrobium sp. CS1GBMeth3 TaxID=1892845 RepID=UPI0009F9C91D|nr:precorrin-3B synthase [Hyphomicrobium sp. CS1GBMeth3]
MSAIGAMAEPASVKGWCPGALRPMQTGDGLIVRVRPRCGAISVAQVLALCEVATRHGNGHIDLTRRANLQIRGIDACALPEVWAALSGAGLMDAHAHAEAVRNVIVSPLAGIDPTEICDVRPIAAALEQALADMPALWSLPGKFGFSVDGGGLLGLDGERADIRFKAVAAEGRVGIALGVDTVEGTRWLCVLDRDEAVTAAVRLARAFVVLPKLPRARIRDLDESAFVSLRSALGDDGSAIDHASVDVSASDRVGLIEARGEMIAVGLGAPFGRLTAETLALIASTAGDHAVTAFRVSPWRVLYAAVPDRDAAVALSSTARDYGLVTVPADPIIAIDACPGAPACRSACGDTRAAARRIAAMMPLPGVSSAHVSGCAKGCARSRSADLVLVAGSGGFGIVRHGTAATAPNAYLAPADLNDLPAILRSGA